MIEKLELKDFKSHVHTEVNFGRLTLLVGPNSSGKTSVLEAMVLFCRAFPRTPYIPPATSVQGLDVLIRQGEKSFVVACRGISRSEEFVGSIRRRYGDDHVACRLSYQGKRADYNPRQWDLYVGDRRREFKSVHEILAQAVHLKLSPRRLAAPSYSEEIPPQVGSYGEGLASTLAYLMTNEPERFQDLMRRIKVVLPFVKGIRVRPAKVRLAKEKVLSFDDKTVPVDTSLDVTGHEMLLDTEGVWGVPSQVVSDGTLLTIGLLTILASPTCPDLILLDDVEQGLHPRAQRELVGALKQFLEERPDLQIVLTTHSPYVVDEVDASDVWVLAANAAGRTRARRLTEVPDAKKALEVLTTGELWAAEGEDWVHEAAGGDD